MRLSICSAFANPQCHSSVYLLLRVQHGRAEGLQTINSLALLGGAIACVGNDPMGLDKFSRFNQTLQEFFDGAARVGATV